MMFASGDKKPKLTRLMTPTDFAFSIICFMVVSWSRGENSLFLWISQQISLIIFYANGGGAIRVNFWGSFRLPFLLD